VPKVSLAKHKIGLTKIFHFVISPKYVRLQEIWENMSRRTIPVNEKYIMFDLVTIFPVLNSLFNPLIYAVRIRYFRVAFIQLLLRKTFAQAEQSERNAFGRKQSGVVATAEQVENRVSRGNEVLQGRLHGIAGDGRETVGKEI